MKTSTSFMNDMLRRLLPLAAAIALLPGCAAALVGTGAVVGAASTTDRRSTGTMIDDEIVEFKAIDAIRKDPQLLEQSHINATSYNLIVLLTGETPSQELRGRATELIKTIPKVRRVQNELAIAAPSSMLSRSSDSVITGKIKTAILRYNIEVATRTKIITENGVVFLLGLLTRAEAEAATEAARKVSGVQRVVKMFEYVD